MLLALVTQVDLMFWNRLNPPIVLTELVLQVDFMFETGHADCEIRVLLWMVDMKSSHRIINRDFLRSLPNQLELEPQ